ncbi:aldehyde dehydrogenase (naD) family protein [Cardiosporidium cionae]|uniref:Aldehyde dehydrogenase (NaD) family protein n=1 Tax=Cardiosporidium cionae TaxID=476202 RepID=A0ABQ7JAI7_9APIC|nr:aldehyde dehydrogenase (naD) family protein [Cardiosporidium cionae]|eukprot:KAF8821001.1 aldehyde dehydrogenase (naD) family protein [Cardiosporidium cionae]
MAFLPFRRALTLCTHSSFAIERKSGSRKFSSLSSFATVNPAAINAKNPHTIQNLVGGEWCTTSSTYSVVDPLNGEPFITSPFTNEEDFPPFIQSLQKVSKSGQHNPFKKPERYVMYGEVLQKAASYLNDTEIFDFFVKCIQRTMPKTTAQAAGEVKIIKKFCENFSGDSVRFLVRGFSVAGDHMGQQSHGYRWPYGPVAIISPFNFPLEIPVMQFLSAAMVGNKPLVKCHSTQGLSVEQFLRFLHFCGLPQDEIDFINTRGTTMFKLIEKAPLRLLQFTGGSSTAEKLITVMKGRVRVEDSGFDWKILGPDVKEIPYVAWQCDQDAYAISGQKCSAQSFLLAHTNWIQAGLLDQLKKLAERRSLEDMTCSPILSLTNGQLQEHVDALLRIPGARLLFGGSPFLSTSIPSIYGAYPPTAVFIPFYHLKAAVETRTLEALSTLSLVYREMFGPIQVITEWNSAEEASLLAVLEAIPHHLTAAIVSSDNQFYQRILGQTVNGTTYVGQRARTTGAPQNHWFGPSGDPIGAGIGTPEAVLHTWTAHREIVEDLGPIPVGWKITSPT